MFAPLCTGCAPRGPAWLVELTPAARWVQRGPWGQQNCFPSDVLTQTSVFCASLLFEGGESVHFFFLLTFKVNKAIVHIRNQR